MIVAGLIEKAQEQMAIQKAIQVSTIVEVSKGVCRKEEATLLLYDSDEDEAPEALRVGARKVPSLNSPIHFLRMSSKDVNEYLDHDASRAKFFSKKAPTFGDLKGI